MQNETPKSAGLFLIFGKGVKDDYSNIKSLQTTVIPNIGDTIVVNHKKWKVLDKWINYSNVEDYNDILDCDRGAEMIYTTLQEIF